MHLKPRGLVILGMLFLMFLGFCNESEAQEKKVFPKPEKTKNFLFYVQRTLNTNTLIYELNADEKGQVDMEDPIKIYWKNYAGNGKTEPLNYIQRKYAYGLEVKMIDAAKKTFCFNFVSYKKRQLYLIKSALDNKYDAFILLNNKLVILNSVFIQIEGGTYWVPKIKYVEIKGKDIYSNEEVVERIIP